MPKSFVKEYFFFNHHKKIFQKMKFRALWSELEFLTSFLAFSNKKGQF